MSAVRDATRRTLRGAGIAAKGLATILLPATAAVIMVFLLAFGLYQAGWLR